MGSGSKRIIYGSLSVLVPGKEGEPPRVIRELVSIEIEQAAGELDEQGGEPGNGARNKPKG